MHLCGYILQKIFLKVGIMNKTLDEMDKFLENITYSE